MHRILSNHSPVKCMDILPLALVTFTSGTKALHTLHSLNEESQRKKETGLL